MSDFKKPLFRGRIHQIAFYKTIILSLIFTITFISLRKCSLSLIIYLLSQLILYGVSSTYHLTKFRSDKIRRIFQKLDHSSIFILIAGTQTSVFMLLICHHRQALKFFLVLTWSISLIGILKIFLFDRIIEMMDVVFYIIHGVIVIPFIHLMRGNVTYIDLMLFVLGGVLYISGGLIFGMERPNPFPNVFGFHEIFHSFTVLANMCFMVPIIAKSIALLRNQE